MYNIAADASVASNVYVNIMFRFHPYSRVPAGEERHSSGPTTATAADVKSAEDADDFESLSCQLATMGLQIR